MNDMSQKFRDAINLTHGLGLSYSWIDSPCILQDSEEDWIIQSTKMSEIYKHVFVTISVFSSAEGYGTGMPSYKYSLVDVPCRMLPDLYVDEEYQAFDSPSHKTERWILEPGLYKKVNFLQGCCVVEGTFLFGNVEKASQDTINHGSIMVIISVKTCDMINRCGGSPFNTGDIWFNRTVAGS
jgi:Heterokaryon incompatibility protein (HET)